MNNKLLPILFLFILALVSCQNENTNRQLIEQAERVAVCHPDSAYLLLDRVSLPDALSNKLLARWCMLYGQTADKLFKAMPYVSQLLRARNWYRKNGTLEQQAWIGLYLGRSYVADRLHLQATDAYSEALTKATKGNAYNAAGYICSYMADLYDYNGMVAEGRRKYEEAAIYFKKAGNMRSYALALRDVGSTWFSEDSCVLALDYLLRADSIVTSLNDSVGMGSIANGLGNVYLAMGDMDKSEYCLLKSLLLDSLDWAPTYSALSQLHLSQGNLDSARYYVKLADIKTHNQYTPVLILYKQYEIEKASNHLDKALAFLEEYDAAKDSLYDSKREVDILDAEKRYDQLLLLNENSELRIAKLTYIILFFISVVVCLLVYLFYQVKDKKRIRKINEQNLLLEQKENQFSSLMLEVQRLSLFEQDRAIVQRVQIELEGIRKEVIQLRYDKLCSYSIFKKVKKMAQKVVAGVDHSPLSDKDWKSMIDTVNIIYKSLSTFLSDGNHNLSQSELKYCYLSIFRFSNFEESILLNINPESVNKTRLRVRQKLDLVGRDLSLYDCLIMY